MFKLGEFDEEAAKEIRGFLDDAGIRVEMKPFLSAGMDTSYTLKGRLNYLREQLKDLGKFERYLSVLKSVLSRCKTINEFEDLFRDEMAPSWRTQREELMALSDIQGGRSEEDVKILVEKLKAQRATFIDIAIALDFANTVISDNQISIGEPLENKLDDPLLELPFDPSDYDTMPENYRENIRFAPKKMIAIYIDEYYAPLACEIDDDFWELYPEEALQLRMLGLLMEKLDRASHSGKMDMKQLARDCSFEMDSEGGSLWIDGSEVAEELARSLEKHGALKIKGDKIKWKS